MAAYVPDLEEALAPPVGRYFARRGYDVAFEVGFNGRYADLVVAKGDVVEAVELKLRDWRVAVRQAIAYQVGCTHTWIGVPLLLAGRLASRPQHARILEDAGVGLLGVNWPQPAGGGDVRVLIQPAESPRRLPFLEDALRRVVTTAGEAPPPPPRSPRAP